MNRLADYLQAQKFTEEASKAEGDVWFSEAEIRLAAELAARGLHFVQQKRVERGSSSSVFDFLVEGALVVEVDGREFHRAGADAARDRDALERYGLRTLRIPGWKAMLYPEEAVSLVALRLSELSRLAA